MIPWSLPAPRLNWFIWKYLFLLEGGSLLAPGYGLFCILLVPVNLDFSGLVTVTFSSLLPHSWSHRCPSTPSIFMCVLSIHLHSVPMHFTDWTVAPGRHKTISLASRSDPRKQALGGPVNVAADFSVTKSSLRGFWGRSYFEHIYTTVWGVGRADVMRLCGVSRESWFNFLAGAIIF